MDVKEALELLVNLDLIDPYAKSGRSPEEDHARAKQVSALLPTTPLNWALGFLRKSARDGSVPHMTDFASSWRTEALRRIEAVEVPPAPPAIENDPDKWREWERARRAALVQGANAEQAVNHGNKLLGIAAPTRLQIGQSQVSPDASAAAKKVVFERLAVWEKRQSNAQNDMNFTSRGGDEQ